MGARAGRESRAARMQEGCRLPKGMRGVCIVKLRMGCDGKRAAGTVTLSLRVMGAGSG